MEVRKLMKKRILIVLAALNHTGDMFDRLL